MKRRIKKVILLVFLSLIIIGISYVGSYYIDKLYKDDEKVSLKVVFDDTETYVIPNNVQSNKEDVLKTWPYMFSVLNDSQSKGLYQIIINDQESSTIERNNLNYLLVLDDKEVKESNLGEIKENILYTYEIAGKTSQRYKIYIWSTSDETKKDDIYEYKISLNAIKDGGPGF